MEARFGAAGVTSVEQMYALSCSQMLRVWGSVRGEIWWRLLRGEAVVEPPTIRRSVGHSHVLPPSLRSPWGAASVVRRLLEKAGERLRHLGYQARGLSVHARGSDHRRWQRKVRLAPCQDTWTLMEALDLLWEHPFPEPKQVAVVLYDLLPAQDTTLPLFPEMGQRLRASRAVDGINQRFGRRTLTMASVLPVRHTAEEKIAFGRVRELD